MPYYLDEYTFRFNRRTSASRGKLFYRLIEQAVEIEPTVYKSIAERKGAYIMGKYKNNLKLDKYIEIFCGKTDDAEIIEGEYCLFVLGNEKFSTTTLLRECVYGKKATTRRLQRFYK